MNEIDCQIIKLIVTGIGESVDSINKGGGVESLRKKVKKVLGKIKQHYQRIEDLELARFIKDFILDSQGAQGRFHDTNIHVLAFGELIKKIYGSGKIVELGDVIMLNPQIFKMLLEESGVG